MACRKNVGGRRSLFVMAMSFLSVRAAVISESRIAPDKYVKAKNSSSTNTFQINEQILYLVNVTEEKGFYALDEHPQRSWYQWLDDGCTMYSKI
jgi:hypothetical protein